jgi:hypothetical protein
MPAAGWCQTATDCMTNLLSAGLTNLDEVKIGFATERNFRDPKN